MMKKKPCIVLIALLYFIQLSAQIQPPDFLCVRGDTLFWTPTVNTCGPFNSYEVWGSQSPAGPFVLLTSLTDPSKNFFFHVNPSGEQWFFYLRSNHNCPGQMALSSDTLDNRPPEISPIESVSVIGGSVVITWKPSPSPEVFGYIVYHETPIGVVPIDTVFSGNTYIDTASEPDMQPESYYVNALDPCGNTSIFDAKHSTIFLEGTLNPCRQSVNLNWNLYQNWTNGIGEHQIWASVNGGAPVLTNTTGDTASSFEFQNLNDGDVYCIFVQAVEAGTGVVSRSNEICLTADIVQAVRDFFITNVSWTPANLLEITWAWNANAEVKEVKILGATQNNNFQPIGASSPVAPLPPLATYLDASYGPPIGKVFYKMQTLDNCDSVSLSTYGSAVFLSGFPFSINSNQLDWTKLDIENAVVSEYEIFKSINGAITSVGTVDSATTSLIDIFDPTDLAAAQACYYVITKALLTTPDGSTIPIQSRSNTFCIEQNVRILVPNAFVPEGYNQIFKPLIVLGDLTSYEMRIFDRYGQEVFVSKAEQDGWNGKKGGKNMPQDTYIYQIRVTQSGGRIVEKRGTVLLLR